MPGSKRAISVTLAADNITWLRARSRAPGGHSLSAFLDQLVTAARQAGHTGPSRSVIGTIDVDASDPHLEGADAAIRTLFDASVGRPMIVREGRGRYGARASKRRG